MGDAAATGVMAVGYEGLKAGAFAMKDHNMRTCSPQPPDIECPQMGGLAQA